MMRRWVASAALATSALTGCELSEEQRQFNDDADDFNARRLDVQEQCLEMDYDDRCGELIDELERDRIRLERRRLELD